MRWHPFQHFGLKIAALAMGVLLWFVVSSQQVVRSVSVPVLYHTAPGLQLTGRPISEVTVQIRGGYSQISQLARNDIAAVVNLTEGRPGEVVIPLSPNQVSAPLGIDVTQVDPATLTVMLEKSGSGLLTVKPIVEGTPAAGYVVNRVTADPAQVMAVGPVSRLDAMPPASTQPVSVEGATKDVTQTVTVGVADSELRLRDVRTVRVTVHIVRKSD